MAGSSQALQEAPALTVVMVEALPLETTQAITQALFWEEHQQAATKPSLPRRRYMVANLNREISTRQILNFPEINFGVLIFGKYE